MRLINYNVWHLFWSNHGAWDPACLIFDAHSLVNCEMLVQYLVQVPTPDDEPVLDPPIGSFEVEDCKPFTLTALQDAWPFAGNFQFRVRFALAPEATFGWLDLTAADDEVPVTGGVCIVRALPLFPIKPVPRAEFTLSPVEYEAWLHESALRRAAEQRLKGGNDVEETPAPAQFDSWLASAAPGPSVAVAESRAPTRAERASTAGSDPWGVFGDAAAQVAAPGAPPPANAAAASSAVALAASASAVAGNMLQGFRGFMAGASRAVAAAAAGGGPGAPAAAAPPAKGGDAKAGGGASSWFSGVAKGARVALASAAKAVLDKKAPGGAPAPASPEAAANLAALQRLLHTPARHGFTPHESLLRRLWAAAYGAEEPFELPSALWAQLGYDGEDPCEAINHQNAGILSLYALLHVAETHSAAFDEMVARAVSAAAAGDSEAAGPYPPALAVMALSCRLAQTLGLDEDSSAAGGSPGRAREPFWEVFGGPDGQTAFYEIVGLMWRVFDRAWVVEGSRAADFERVVDGAATRARAWLDHGPQSLELLVSAAEMEGVTLGPCGPAAGK